MVKYNENNTIIEMWYQRSWRPMMAFVYMMLCILDYGVRPVINYYQTKILDLPAVVSAIQPLEPIVQIEILNTYKTERFSPILTEFVHLTFAAVLGIAAFSRGSGKGFIEGSPNPNPQRNNQQEIQQSNRLRNEDDEKENERADG